MSRDWLDKNFYAILGVPQNASTDDIKKAYKKLARENHPDLNPGDPEAEKKFKEVSEANAVIGDERKRQEYDQMRAMGASGFGGFSSRGFTVDDFSISGFPMGIMGDYNMDLVADIFDLLAIADIILFGGVPTDAQLFFCDLDGSGVIDVMDIINLANLILGI